MVDSAPAFAPIDGRPSRVLNEAAFRYFFELERARATEANRPLLLLLVRVPSVTRPAGAASSPASKIFAALTACVRDADIVGWYREGTIAGAVLIMNGAISSGARHAVCGRVVGLVSKSLAAGGLTRVSVHMAVVGHPGEV